MDGKITRVSPEFFRKKKESRWNGIISTVGNFRLIYDENVCGIISTVGGFAWIFGRINSSVTRKKDKVLDKSNVEMELFQRSAVLFYDENVIFRNKKVLKWNYFNGRPIYVL